MVLLIITGYATVTFMSAEMFERNPNERSDYANGTRYGEAYCMYLEAMAMRDIAELTAACHVLEETDFPLMDRIEEHTDLMHDALLESDPAKFTSIANHIFPDVLRSYVYSGIEINPPLISFFTQLAGHDKKWLRSTLKPTPQMYMHVGADLDDLPHLQELRFYGRRSLLQLGLGSIGMKLSAKFGLLSYTPMAAAEWSDFA